MGFTNIMKLQENPDGIEGHNERDVLQEISKCAPAKKKYTGLKKRFHPKQSQTPELTKEQRIAISKRNMKNSCQRSFAMIGLRGYRGVNHVQ